VITCSVDTWFILSGHLGGPYFVAMKCGISYWIADYLKSNDA
jgi:hypothetical protein